MNKAAMARRRRRYIDVNLGLALISVDREVLPTLVVTLGFILLGGTWALLGILG